MPILNTQEAVEILQYSDVSEMPAKVTTILLPAIDDYIKNATGKDWGKDTEINPTAKMVATMLLMRWFEDSNEIGNGGIGVISLINQLQAVADKEKQG